jgi:hypothetical protein
MELAMWQGWKKRRWKECKMARKMRRREKIREERWKAVNENRT